MGSSSLELLKRLVVCVSCKASLEVMAPPHYGVQQQVRCCNAMQHGATKCGT